MQLLEELIWNLGDSTNAGQRLLARVRVQLAEMLVLAFWPGPTADVLVIAGPDDMPAEINFNFMR